jgi:protein transport protein SEC24
VTVEIKHDDKLDEQPAFIQVCARGTHCTRAYTIQAALLFTSPSGQRRLRIHNLSLANGANASALYRSTDCDAVVTTLFKQAERMQRVDKSPKDVRDWLTARCAQVLATYREKCSEMAPAGQLILPETLKLLPLYVNSITRNDALAGGE